MAPPLSTGQAAEMLAPYAGVGLGLALGLLIGIERGWTHRLEADGTRVAGIRTFGILGLTGGIAAKLALEVSAPLGTVLALAAAAAVLIGYAGEAAKGSLSATNALVGLLTLGLGALAAAGQGVLASIVAAVTTLVLTQRRRLHGWIGRMSEAEVHAIARFGLVALAILPLLPDRAFGPYDSWNPRQIWLVVVLVSGLSLVGYAATKLFGASKGVLATAALGSIVSSTAVTAAMAARIREGEGDEAALIAGIGLASAVMFTRVLLLVGGLAPFAVGPLALVALPAGLVSAAWTGFLLWRPRAKAEAEAEPAKAAAVRNPFDLGPALILAILVMAISLAGRWGLETFGGAGLAVVLGISGAIDVDAAVVTLGGLPAGALAPGTAGLVLAAPILANTLVKAGLTIVIARGSAGWRAAAPLLLSVLAGLGGVAVLLAEGFAQSP
jgi:uncharacterized membrane protein (DUF4010 family)